VVDAITSDETKAIEMSDEVLARNQQLESGRRTTQNDAVQSDLEVVTYYESYIRLVIDQGRALGCTRFATPATSFSTSRKWTRSPSLRTCLSRSHTCSTATTSPHA
jgi:predicted glutamine amidotransferase